MAPSRGEAASDTSAPTSGQAPSTSPDSKTAKESHALGQERSAAANVRRNLAYMWNPATVPAAQRPSNLRTRALLRSLRYVGTFLYWRAYRWAKYAVVGAVVGAVGSFAFAGTMATGIGAIIAPTGILASIAVGTIWWSARFAWRLAARRYGRKPPAGVAHDPQVHPRFQEREPEFEPW